MSVVFVIVSIICVIGLIVCIICSPVFKGKIGEGIVSARLSLLPKDEYIVLNNLMFSSGSYTTQIDHIVISVYGIFVIETKNYQGWIYGDSNRDYWTQNIWGNRYSLYNPILQNRNHIKFLIRKFVLLSELTEHIHPIVVFLRASRINVSGDANGVIWLSQLYDFIKHFRYRIMTIEECKRIADLLKKEKIIGKDGRRNHINNVRTAIYNREKKISAGICPRCGGKLVARNGKYGSFFGCSNYPRCLYTC